MSLEAQTPPPAGPYHPGAAPEPPVRKGTSGLAIAGFVLAILVAPVGFILSIIGLIQAGRGGQKGKGLAIAGILISLILMIGSGALIVVAGNKVSTLADPGCITGKAAILDNADKINNTATVKDGLQATVNGLSSAATQAKHDNVRNAMKALGDDYSKLLDAVNGGTAPDPGLQDKINTDAKAIDSLCSIGK